MSFKLSSKTKEIISKRIGIPYEKLIQMDDEEIEAYTAEVEELQKGINDTSDIMIRVKGMVYPGTKICMGDVSMVVQKSAHYCRFVRERGDVKMVPF